MKRLSIFLVLIIVCLLAYIFFVKNKVNNSSVSVTSTSTLPVVSEKTSAEKLDSQGNKIFVFDNFHGLTDTSLKFTLSYPSGWYNEGQYFSPQKIEHYDLYSVRSAFYFDFILANIFPQTELKYQIDKSKRASPDSHGKIDGVLFERYDLIDSGTYGGDSAGRVLIYLGPKVMINSAEYYLVFHWEEKPLASVLPGNSADVIEKSIMSLKFSN